MPWLLLFKGDGMENRYMQKIHLRTSDFDTFGRIKPSAVLDLFQEVAGAHAEELGIGFESLSKNNLLWVITKVKYEVVGKVPMHQSVTVHTWPKEPSRITFEREYLVENEKGEVVIRGSSEWVTMHSEKRCIVPVKDIYPLDSFCEDKNFEGKFTKVPNFESENVKGSVIPQFCDLDRNGHVNNIKYADFVLNTVDLGKKEITFFQADYHREIKKGMPVDILAFCDDNEILAKGISEDGEKMFSCRICLK